MKSIKEKKERALGVKLFIKADRCNSPKCVTVRRPYRPGVHGQARRRQPSEYGRELKEKQKLQIIYGLTNRQMMNLFGAKSPDDILKHLEKRLDRVVFLLGLAKSTRIARQLVSHGHILVNGRKVTIPSYYVKVGEKIEIRPESRGSKLFEDIQVRLKQYTPPAWLKLDAQNLKGECVEEPVVEGSLPFDINLVGEFYAR
ncbi:30S ribosomal protein S4 [Patescibacteria group bacterium]|nr:30S ribosomal protein S4 [Patescibacteria group bacterium]